MDALGEDTLKEARQEYEAMQGRKSGFAVWRVKQLTLEKVKEDDVGIFYKGDCYVILSVNKGTNYIYFWIGQDSSQDEQAFAAMATVDMDDEVCGGSAIQVREVTGSETPRFKEVFKDNIIIKDGGHKTAMRKISVSNEPAHLYKVKGKLRPVVSEVSSRTSSLNPDDCYILDVARKHKCVFVLRGGKSNKEEATKAIKMARKFQSRVVVLDENEISSCGEEENKVLHDSLGVSRTRPIKFEGMDKVTDEQQDSEVDKTTELCRVHDRSIENVPVKQSSLDSGDCFVLKTAKNVYVWKGRKSSKEEKRGALAKAQELIRQKGMAPTTQITIVPENIEPVDFKGCFVDWREKEEVTKYDYSKPIGGNVAKSVHTVIDFRTLYNKPAKERKDPLSEDDLDHGEGRKTIYRIIPEGKGAEDERILENNDGFVFNSGESYVIVYQYRSKQARSKERAIIYFWIGNDSEQKEHGAAALVASDIDSNQFHDDAIQIRVTEAKEPLHFMKIFGGFIMIKQPHFDDQGARMYHIRGKAGNIKVVEVSPIASNLNSNDCFVLRVSRKKVYIWLGRGSLGDEQRIAHEAAVSMFGTSCEFMKLVEGKTEPQNFWDALGGKTDYHNILETVNPSEVCGEREPRLFRLFNIRGSMEVEEVFDFSQDDLLSDDVFYLDVFTTIYVWFGKDSTKEERVGANRFLKDFIDSDPSGRTARDVSVIMVAQGKENIAPGFTAYFGVWETHREEKVTYEQMKKLAVYETSGRSAAEHLILLQKEENARYSYDELQNNEDLPDHLDLTKKELYLHEDEFQSLFGMTLVDFYKKPEWKQMELKKRVNLF